MGSDLVDKTAVGRVLTERFGHDGFREGQQLAIDAAMAGADLLAVMPTGSGKSLCYQLPAVLQSGYALVVSPLIALMKDQVDQMRTRGIPAGTLHSGLTLSEKQHVTRELVEGRLDILLVAPERFRNERFLELLRRHPPSRLVVDEAHCISQWGHDFRPDYRRLSDVRSMLGGLPVTALTATATPDVRRDIATQLDLSDPVEILTGFDRPNLQFEAIPADTKKDKLANAEDLVRKTDGIRLIYAASRRSVDEVTAHFADHDLVAAAYHAGLPDHERTLIQDRFMAGEIDLLVATNAFGMGEHPARVALRHAGVARSVLPGSRSRRSRWGAGALRALSACRRLPAATVLSRQRQSRTPADPAVVRVVCADQRHGGCGASDHLRCAEEPVRSAG
jgi:ATP-dependent DNA helicase RecQ